MDSMVSSKFHTRGLLFKHTSCSSPQLFNHLPKLLRASQDPRIAPSFKEESDNINLPCTTFTIPLNRLIWSTAFVRTQTSSLFDFIWLPRPAACVSLTKSISFLRERSTPTFCPRWLISTDTHKSAVCILLRTIASFSYNALHFLFTSDPCSSYPYPLVHKFLTRPSAMNSFSNASARDASGFGKPFFRRIGHLRLPLFSSSTFKHWASTQRRREYFCFAASLKRYWGTKVNSSHCAVSWFYSFITFSMCPGKTTQDFSAREALLCCMASFWKALTSFIEAVPSSAVIVDFFSINVSRKWALFHQFH